jgi:hypothetical protein
MINIDEIEREILSLENKDTSYAACEKLACLYTVRDHLKPVKALPEVTGSGAFLERMKELEPADAWQLITELVQAVEVLNPTLYERFINRTSL